MDKNIKTIIKQHLAVVLNEHYCGILHDMKDGKFVDKKDIKVDSKTKDGTIKAVKACLKKAGVEMKDLDVKVHEGNGLVRCEVIEEDGDIVLSASVIVPKKDEDDKKDEDIKKDVEVDDKKDEDIKKDVEVDAGKGLKKSLKKDK